MSNALIVSNILLWIVVIVMAVVIFALVRQIGVLYELSLIHISEPTRPY